MAVLAALQMEELTRPPDSPGAYSLRLGSETITFTSQ